MELNQNASRLVCLLFVVALLAANGCSSSGSGGGLSADVEEYLLSVQNVNPVPSDSTCARNYPGEPFGAQLTLSGDQATILTAGKSGCDLLGPLVVDGSTIELPSTSLVPRSNPPGSNCMETETTAGSIDFGLTVLGTLTRTLSYSGSDCLTHGNVDCSSTFVVSGSPCSDCLMCDGGICGNGVVEGDEECDDGNASNDDDCSSACETIVHDEAVAKIVAYPAGGQRTGLPFTFDAATSTTDPQLQVECYNWELTSNLSTFDVNALGCAPCPVPGSMQCSTSCEARGANRSLLTLVLGAVGDRSLDQDLNVTLKISDDPTVVCQDGTPIDPGLFSSQVASISYAIRCDVTPPFVEAGADQMGSLSAGGGVVSAFLGALGSDIEDTVLDYAWDCGNGTGGASQAVTCEYASVGMFTATVTAVNDCGLMSVDFLVVSVNP